jgi:hypothetical protein
VVLPSISEIIQGHGARSEAVLGILKEICKNEAHTVCNHAVLLTHKETIILAHPKCGSV